MRNKIVGMLVIGIALLVGFIIFSFNKALTGIINTSCGHGPECPMWRTLNFQTNVAIAIMMFIILIGLYLTFFGKEEKVVTKVKTIKQGVEPKEVTRENYKKVIESLDGEERDIFEKIIEGKGTIFQSSLVDDENFTKVKVTRILDKLEGRGLIERKRRGMTNIVILKH